jgi:hypothetical protein
LGSTALTLATLQRDDRALELLLQNAADPNVAAGEGGFLWKMGMEFLRFILVGGLEHEESSQLTFIFSEGLEPPTSNVKYTIWL